MNTQAAYLPSPELHILHKLQAWKAKLLDLSHGNRLLFFKHTKSSSTAITYPAPDDLFQQIVAKGRTLTFPLAEEQTLFDLESPTESAQSKSDALRRYKPGEIGSPLPDKQLSRVLYNLRSRARSALEEQGVNVLFLTFGMLRWAETEGGEPVLAPLLLVPVTLNREALRQPYTLAMLEEDIVLNPTLAHKLETDFALRLPEPADDLEGAGLASYLAQVQAVIQIKKGWAVQNDITLGTFSFQKLSLYEDLKTHHNLFIAHPLISAIGGNQPLPTPGELIEAKDLDDRVPPATVFQVVDADSSQQEAIQAAKLGASFVLQGPPGTGKSQTITNIIAEFLAAGKKVLFVSEKMAALEVVHHRLTEAGLGEFCLELHSHKRDKREVVKELVQSLETPVRQLTPAAHTVLQTVGAAREALNAYVRALHQLRFALQLSCYAAQGELAAREATPVLSFPLGVITSVDHSEFSARKRLLEQFVALPVVINHIDQHPWRGSTVQDFTFELRDRLSDALDTLIDLLPGYQAGLHMLSAASGLRPPATLAQGAGLPEILGVYQPAFFNLELNLWKLKFDKRYARFYRWLLPAYRADMKTLRGLRATSTHLDYEQARRDVTLGATVKARLSDGEAPMSRIGGAVEAATQCRDMQQRLNHCLQSLAQVFGDNLPTINGQSFFDTGFVDVLNWLSHRRAHLSSLADWASFLRLREDARQRGLSEFVETALKQKLSAAHWLNAYLKAFYKGYLDAAYAESEALRRFDGRSHTALVEQFRELDRQQLIVARARIHAMVGERRPKTSWVESPTAEQAILRREAAKKRRLKPLRRLCSEIPRLITDLRPCLLMSPLTVSMFLDPNLFKFDLVIFDEASQIAPEEAAGAILRGNQTIVVGDSQQLPPTRFFAVLTDDDVDEDALYEDNVFDSILEECQGVSMAQKMLLWHYRSRHESLIAFSNYHFYNNRLFTFPSAQHQAPNLGLEFVHVPDGIYRRGALRRNDVEARRVVDLILEHAQKSPDRSLGVVALGISQQEAIRLEWERRRRERPDFEPFFDEDAPEPFFVKNLETVQGDERDAIIFSIGFGKDETGKLTLNFGPINRAGGERRLNVAVSRARYQVKLVSSITPEDIDLTHTNSRGARLLRQYMEIARDGLKALYADTTASALAEVESPFEQVVYEVLTQKGYTVHPQVGVSGYRIDLAVVHPDQPGRYILGIECDGATYHSAKTARDRDRLRQQVLENLGWRIHRIWSRDWITNRQREIDKLIAVIESALADRKSPPPDPSSSPPHKVEPDTTKRFLSETTALPIAPPLPKNVEPYRRITLGARPRGVEGFARASYHPIIADLVQVVQMEGPIHIELAFERILDTWHIARRGNRIQDKLRQVVYLAETSNRIRRKGDFLWPVTMTTPPVRRPELNSDPRAIEHVALEEIAEAAYLCIAEARSLDRADLITETARLLGYNRVGAKIEEALEKAIEILLAARRIEVTGNVIRLPS